MTRLIAERARSLSMKRVVCAYAGPFDMLLCTRLSAGYQKSNSREHRLTRQLI